MTPEHELPDPPSDVDWSDVNKYLWRYSWDKNTRREQINLARRTKTDRMAHNYEYEQRVAAETPPTRPLPPPVEECDQIMVLKPTTLAEARSELYAAARRVSAAPHAPRQLYQRVLESTEIELSQSGTSGYRLNLVLRRTHYFNTEYDRRKEFEAAAALQIETKRQADQHLNERVHASMNSLFGFNAGALIGRLAQRGITLTPLSDGSGFRASNPDALSEIDRQQIHDNRAAITNALRTGDIV